MNNQKPVNPETVRRTEYEIDPVYLRRWSSRSFDSRPIEEHVLMSLFEAARWATSANNEQPWRFIVAQTAEERERFYTFISESNREWCAKAPVLILVLSAKINSRGNVSRSHAFDAGTAWGYLALEAARKGLNSRPMGGFDREKAKEVLQIPEDFEPHIVAAVGYRGPNEALPERLRERDTPTLRKPIEETLFRGVFGQAIRR
jgi:nitroreductase